MMRGRELLLCALAFVGCVSDDSTNPKDGGSDATTNDGGPTNDTGPSNDGGTDAGTCKTGDFRCNGLSLEQCQNGAYVLYKQCVTAALCSPDAGDCAPAVCQPGDLRCTGAKFQKCNSGQSGFDDVKQCATAALCRSDAGADGGCIPPACQPGETQCSPPACPVTDECIGVCNANQTGFDLQNDCGNYQSGVQCCPPITDGGAAYCSNSGC